MEISGSMANTLNSSLNSVNEQQESLRKVQSITRRQSSAQLALGASRRHGNAGRRQVASAGTVG